MKVYCRYYPLSDGCGAGINGAMHNLASFIRRVARGKHGSEHLSITEAQQAFAALLQPDADPLQLGAFLIAERMKGETADELAGFVMAARQQMSWQTADISLPEGAVDLPCYAGKRRASPVHLMAALQMRDAGVPVVVHGVTHIAGRLSAWQALSMAGVQRADDAQTAIRILRTDGIVYLDLADICPPLWHIYGLRDRLGVRNFANTVARLLNPLGCAGQLNGMFHTPYAKKMALANMHLGQQRSLIFMGAEGEPELYADRQKTILYQCGMQMMSVSYPGVAATAYPKTPATDPAGLKEQFRQLLDGRVDTRENAVLQRMHEAFRLLSDGSWPQNWQKEVV